MKKSNQITRIAKELIEDQYFMTEIKHFVLKIQHESTSTSDGLVEFAFQKNRSSYPWSVYDGRQTVQGMEIIQQISTSLFQLFDNNLHAVLNKEFINVTNQILAMRDEISMFTRQQLKKEEELKLNMNKQLTDLKKKMIVQQSTVNFSKQPIQRLRTSANINPGNTQFLPEAFQKKSYHNELFELKKEIQNLKKQDSSIILKNMGEKIIFVEEKLGNQIMNFKIKIQGIKQKSEKSFQLLESKIESSSNKDIIQQQLKRSLKSSMKVYMDEITQFKKIYNEIDEKVIKLDKGLQEYIMSQCKSLWFQCNNLKRRIENLQMNSNIQNESFILE